MSKNIGICAICGEEKKLTFEHFPPQAAYNKEPVLIKDHRHITPTEGGHLFGKSMRSNRGLGGYRLCKSCNNNTGSWYAKDYTNTVNLALPYILNQKSNIRVKFEIEITPLNFLKQVFTFHLCADHALGALRSESNTKQFILNREDQNLIDKIKIYMYATVSKTHRFIGISTTSIDNLKSFGNYSEFNFHPFGFLLAFDSQPTRFNMKEISSFKKYRFGEKAKINFDIPMMPIQSMAPANYP